MRRNKVVLLILAVILLFLSSCQPTPEQAAVVGKGGNALMETILSERGSGQIAIPTHWDESFEAGRINVKVNADILTPNVKKYMALTAIPKSELSVVLIEKITKHLFKYQSLFQIKPTNNSGYTKQELEHIIVQLKRECEEFEQHVVKRSYTEYRDESIRNSYKKMINEYQEEYKAAPELVEYYPENMEWQYNKTAGDERQLHLATLNEEKTIRKGELEVATSPYGVLLFYQRDFRESYSVGPELDGSIPSLLITAQEAQVQAMDFLSIIRHETGEDYRVFGQNIGYIRPFYEDPSTYANIENDPQCYMFTIYRYYNGIPAINGQSSREGSNSQEYATPWYPEEFTICVDDQGIASITWHGMGIVLETVSDNVPMLSFEEIQARFRQHISLEWAYTSDPLVIQT